MCGLNMKFFCMESMYLNTIWHWSTCVCDINICHSDIQVVLQPLRHQGWHWTWAGNVDRECMSCPVSTRVHVESMASIAFRALKMQMSWVRRGWIFNSLVTCQQFQSCHILVDWILRLEDTTEKEAFWWAAILCMRQLKLFVEWPSGKLHSTYQSSTGNNVMLVIKLLTGHLIYNEMSSTCYKDLR
jgi:hypothetical protein